MIRTASGHAAGLLLLVTAATAQVDQRAAQSPVKHQGGRGTCAAFAISATLETFPGIPTDVSEQLAYATVKLHQSSYDPWSRSWSDLHFPLSAGDDFPIYLSLFSFLGTCHERLLPYDSNPRAVAAETPDAIREYLSLAQVPAARLDELRDSFAKYGLHEEGLGPVENPSDIDTIRRLFDEGALAVPVGYDVHSPSLSELDTLGGTDGTGKRWVVHPGLMYRFGWSENGPWQEHGATLVDCMKRGADLVEQVQSGALHTQPLGPDKEYGGHALTLVGYTDTGFIAKNSWGTEWGEDGYGLISYDYHRLYAFTAATVQRARIRLPELSPFKTAEISERAETHLKVQPIQTPDGPRWRLSTYTMEAKDPNTELVEYRIEASIAGEWTPVMQHFVPAAGVEDKAGMPWTLTTEETARLVDGTSQVRVVARFGRMPIDPATPIEQASHWDTTRTFPLFSTQLGQTLDLIGIR